ncbi:hypothetical protein TeGR_g10004 [Tetraparma gracilis]|uniref:Pseudouridine synthase RsuA/RluA-like domain-containing protein n=1 Tax=Tetraparma gracilis TaxID=2962635 RepID=A0ABQ6NAS1_9STRA|nr:hypothetical protein TeGR_g10004 [Tetraparma gracilis]
MYRPPPLSRLSRLLATQRDVRRKTLADVLNPPKDPSKEGRAKRRKAKPFDPSKPPQPLRADRLLANRTPHSRKEIRKLIAARRVKLHPEETLVPGSSSKYPPSTSFLVDGSLVAPVPPLLLFHKPPNVLSILGPPPAATPAHPTLDSFELPASHHHVGRLDYDTSGLLLFSALGPLTHKLLSPGAGVEKVYRARVGGEVAEEALRARLGGGIETKATGVHEARLIEVEESAGGGAVLVVGVREGKHRMVRRMLANAGHPVEELERVSFGGVELGDLAEGEFRFASEEEMGWAKERFGGEVAGL